MIKEKRKASNLATLHTVVEALNNAGKLGHLFSVQVEREKRSLVKYIQFKFYVERFSLFLLLQFVADRECFVLAASFVDVSCSSILHTLRLGVL